MIDNFKQTGLQNLSDMSDKQKFEFQKAFEKQFTIEHILHLTDKLPNDQELGKAIRHLKFQYDKTRS